MKVILCLSISILGYIVTLSEAQRIAVDPDHLNKLLEEEKYEEFSKIFHIDNPELVRPKQEDEERSTEEAMFDQGLPTGDILLHPRDMEKERQGINFDRKPNSRWRDGIVPYEIASQYNRLQRRRILGGIRLWNGCNECVKFRRRTAEDTDYVFIFNGNGCYSVVGRTGGAQPLSLSSAGCLHDQVIIHEMVHTIGMAHEHNRADRDRYLTVLWNNIPSRWRSQYERINTADYDSLGPYDFYSLLHYPINAPGTSKPAFRIRVSGIVESRLGKAMNFTDLDIRKIEDLYC